jgi:exosortase
MSASARKVGMLSLVGASLAIWYSPVSAVFKLGLSRDAYTHILMILPLSLVLSYFRVREARPALSSSPAMGTSLLLASILVELCARLSLGGYQAEYRLALEVLALVIWWTGSVILCFGFSTYRAVLLPLIFVALMIPFPPQVVNWITRWLQETSAAAADLLFQFAHVPVTRDGILLSIPGLDIEVASECSSIRSSMLLMVSTIFLADLFLHSPWKKTATILTAIPLSVAKNGLRIFTIAELGTRVDPCFLYGWLHHKGGIVFFAIALGAVVLLIWTLRRSESRKVPAIMQPVHSE